MYLNIFITLEWCSNKSKVYLTFFYLVENDCGLTFIPEEMAKQSILDNKCFKVDLIEDIPERFVSFVIKKDASYSSIIYDIKTEILKHK